MCINIERPSLKRRDTSSAHSRAVVAQQRLGFRILCEHEAGWHSYADAIEAPSSFDEATIARFSPYLARIMALLRNSQQLHLNCVAGKQGEQFLDWLEEVSKMKSADHGLVFFKRTFILLSHLFSECMAAVFMS